MPYGFNDDKSKYDLDNALSSKADKADILDSMTDISHNTASGKIVGALALKQLTNTISNLKVVNWTQMSVDFSGGKASVLLNSNYFFAAIGVATTEAFSIALTNGNTHTYQVRCLTNASYAGSPTITFFYII